MKHIAQQIVLVLAILALPFYQANARDIEHHFHSMSKTNTISFTNLNKKATTNDGITYICAGAADFRHDSEWVLSLRLKDENDSVTIAPPLNKLSEIRIFRKPASATNIMVAYSRDGSTWTNVSGGKISSTKDCVTAILPVSAFYIKIYNTASGTPITIQQITYTFLDCNCFTFMPE
jgi:hypothetical protein